MAAITQTWYIFYFHFLVCCMLKRPGTDSNHPNPLKHTWKPAGFWVARPTSVLPSSGSTSSLFITVTQSDEWRSTLNAQTHILSKTQEVRTFHAFLIFCYRWIGLWTPTRWWRGFFQFSTSRECRFTKEKEAYKEYRNCLNTWFF